MFLPRIPATRRSRSAWRRSTVRIATTNYYFIDVRAWSTPPCLSSRSDEARDEGYSANCTLGSNADETLFFFDANAGPGTPIKHRARGLQAKRSAYRHRAHPKTLCRLARRRGVLSVRQVSLLGRSSSSGINLEEPTALESSTRNAYDAGRGSSGDIGGVRRCKRRRRCSAQTLFDHVNSVDIFDLNELSNVRSSLK